jgi:hypothetical protein
MSSILPNSEQQVLHALRTSFPARTAVALGVPLLFLLSTPTGLQASRNGNASNPGFVTEIVASMDDVLRALQEVLEDRIVHGTYMFDKDRTLNGATVAQSTPLFEAWNHDGKVFYKIRARVIAPRHFRDSADQGTIAVRYVVSSVSPERTRLRIDAVFVETARRTLHPSDGTVESSEYKTIRDHLQTIQIAEQEAADAQRRRESADLAKQALQRLREEETARLAGVESSAKEIEEQVRSLRHRIEERVKAPGADLKTAPFRSAANIAALPAYTELVIVIVTPYWHGVETPSGQRGWLPLDRVESLP